MGTENRSTPHSRATAAGLKLEGPQPLAVPSGGVVTLHPSGKMCPQVCQGTAHQSSKSWTRSSERVVMCLELLNSGQKQREGSPRRMLLQKEFHEPWEEAPGQGDTELCLCTKTSY